MNPNFLSRKVLAAFFILPSSFAIGQNVVISNVDVSVLDTQGETYDGIFKPTANTNVAVQDGLTTYNGYQYAGYYNSDHRLCVDRRSLDQGTDWEKIVFTDYFKTSTDNHNGISIGICSTDGTMHIAFDHHVDDLNYKVSELGFANDPEGYSWDESLFSPVRDYLIEGEPIAGLTYPRFVPTTEGNLHFYYRGGGPGNGDTRIVFYDGATSSWSSNTPFLSRDGEYFNAIDGVSNSRSQYHNHILFDDQGTLHTTFTWREKNPGGSGQYNHDIGYIFSEDAGLTWLSNDYTVVADVNTGLEATYFSPEIVVGDIAPELQMINNQAHAVDHKGGVHVVVSHRDTPAESPGITGSGFYRHHYRNALGQWRVDELGFRGQRPKMVSDPQGNLYLLYIYFGKFHIVTASSADDYREWTEILERPIPSAQFIMDSHRMADRGELSIMTQRTPETLGDPTPVYVVDFELQRTDDCQALNDPCEATTVSVAPVDDGTVRGGQFANDNYGDANRLAVENGAANTTSELVTYLRFNIEDLKEMGTIAGAKLRLDVRDFNGGDSENALQGLYFCENDFWTEEGLTYNWILRPALDELLDEQPGNPDFVEWDLTEKLQEQLDADNWLSLAIVGLGDPNGRLTYFSKESGNVAKHPRLLVTLPPNHIAPVADAYVRGGSYSDDSFGDEAEVVVKDDENENFDRLGFLKFDVSAYSNASVERVVLRMHRKAMSAQAPQTPFAAHFVDDDSWEEQSITWNNRPGQEAVPMSGALARGVMEWDVTEAFLEESGSDGLLSLALTSTRAGSARNVNLYTKEAQNAAFHPKLILQYPEDTDPAELVLPSADLTETLRDLDVSVFPNPAIDHFSVVLTDQVSGTAELYGMSGARVKEVLLNTVGQFSFAVDGLASGIYLLKITDAATGRAFTEKVMVE